MSAQARSRVAGGERLAWIFADRIGRQTRLHYVFANGASLVDVGSDAAGSVQSLTPVTPAAEWYEREIRDRFGLEFENLSDDRPLVRVEPPDELRKRESPEISTVLYGPIRSGIVESARWTIDTAGETFVEVAPSMFFKHRGLEERFVGVELELAPFVAEHVSGATASSHAAAFCRAVETVADVHVPERARAARSVLVELERVAQHLDSLGKLADDGSLSVGSAQTFAAKERVHRLLAAGTGHRFGRGVCCVGGTRFDVLASLREACDRELEEVERHARSVVQTLVSTQSLLDRLIGAGKLTYEQVVRFGAVGPVARGSGVSCDARTGDDYFYTPLTGEEVLESNGDAAARALVRAAEIQRSFQLIRNALSANPPGDWLAKAAPRDGCGFARVEAPQGELIYFVRIEGGRLMRVAIRPPSYANWPLFVPSLPGNIFTDFSFIEHSFAASQSEVDR